MKTEKEEEYSIATLLQNLAENKLERKMIELLSKGLSEEEVLKELLRAMKEEQL
jgi:uncharacterized Ntn-hydrolase superfamily protein